MRIINFIKANALAAIVLMVAVNSGCGSGDYSMASSYSAATSSTAQGTAYASEQSNGFAQAQGKSASNIIRNAASILSVIQSVNQVKNALLPEKSAAAPTMAFAPSTNGETPYGFVGTFDDSTIGTLLGFSGFSMDEINNYSNRIVPLVSNLLEQSFDAQVITYTPDLLGTDAETVHNVVASQMLSDMELYLRIYISKVDGVNGENIRLDIYAWVPGYFDDGQFIVRMEFQKSLFDSLVNG